MTTEQRIDRLERSLRRWKQMFIVASIVGITWLTIGAQKDDPFADPESKHDTKQFDKIVCKQLVVINDAGQMVAGITANREGDGAEAGLMDPTIKATEADFRSLVLGLSSTKQEVQATIGASTAPYRVTLNASDKNAAVKVLTLGKVVGSLMALNDGGAVGVTDVNVKGIHLRPTGMIKTP